ncbi:TetR family transcriptional regulator [Periweissella cryptocerci]|uniref:TetR family transcriptional regulator n=1 Tax=Periweissella cryptocerci TaxID=2506420 RepID=A0A4P6YRG2_9LACO|nr:TetR/AcrR family transcriptional regulator [Periweissella cryptocerci]QBO35210.1 TetR family transcriptional regulator [Periweissella cryptocerci]
MRTRDENKIKAISTAVFEITLHEGLAHLSIGKIAKAAGVSPATAYIYYADKTDMLSQIFLEVKVLMDTGLAESLLSQHDLRQQVAAALRHFGHRFIQYPLEANFMQAVQANPDEINAKAYEQSFALAQPLTDLLTKALATETLRTNDVDKIIALTFGAMTTYLQQKFQNKQPVSDADLDDLINLTLHAVFAD